jgi:mannose-1-phosphate guanylyltransferase
MLLSAGVGKRMFPLALMQPKPAIPVLGRPLVVQILHWLGLKGVDRVVLNLHHLPDGIRGILGDGNNPGLPEVSYSLEEQILGTGGGIRHAGSALIGDGPIVVCNADFLSDIDLDAAFRAHRASGCLATLVLLPWRAGYSVVQRDAEGRVLSLGGEPRADTSAAVGKWLFAGCHIIEEELIDRIPAGRPSCMVRDVYRPLASAGRLGSHVHKGFWWEFGSPELYLAGCMRLLAEPAERLKRISSEHDPIRRVGDARVAVGPGAGFDGGARFVGHAALGFSAYVSEDTVVKDSVIMPEAWVGPGCRLERSVIGQSVELPAGFDCKDRVVCADPDPSMELPPSTRREKGWLIYSLSPAEAG